MPAQPVEDEPAEDTTERAEPHSPKRGPSAAWQTSKEVKLEATAKEEGCLGKRKNVADVGGVMFF